MKVTAALPSWETARTALLARTFPAPTLIAVGTKDTLAGSAQALAAIIPGAQALDIPGRDHMLAVGDKAFKAAVPAFLERRP